jgi:hypothetical protein
MVRTRLLGVQSAAAMLQSPLITKQTESGESGEFDAVTDADSILLRADEVIR